ncbi:MAG TPA: pentapeptide repeat-containing protein [Coleofasciculaceae cyanobacterium]
MRGAILIRADLTQANLSGANLLKADLDLAELAGANLSGAIMPDGSRQEETKG